MFNLKNQQAVYDSLVHTSVFSGTLPLDTVTFDKVWEAYDTESVIAICDTYGNPALFAFIVSLYIKGEIKTKDDKVVYSCDIFVKLC